MRVNYRKLPATVKPKVTKGKSGYGEMLAKTVKKAADQSSKKDSSSQPTDSKTQAYKQIGDAGESIVNTYKAKQLEANQGSSGGGGIGGA